MQRWQRRCLFTRYIGKRDSSAKVKNEGVVKSGNIITAQGAGVAWEFGAAINSKVTDETKAPFSSFLLTVVSPSNTVTSALQSILVPFIVIPSLSVYAV